ncbi:MAG: SDR family oxidoreductase [Bacteroidetes bacterium]|nr:SDR family oxidoreductase [Bacteroidota bacterium]
MQEPLKEKNNMKKTALITGASRGIGRELAIIFARENCNLVILARSIDLLESLKTELQAKYKIEVYVIVKDLSKPQSPLEIFEELKQKSIKIDYLVNNAGFGKYGFLHESGSNIEQSMINVNILSLSLLTKLFLNEMVKTGFGKILNVSSVAAFQPGPLMAVYFASKSYVLSFSQALHNEVKDFGITVTALCPGPTKSNFLSNAKLEKSRLFKGGNVAKAADVALFGYRAMMKGKPVAIHGLINKILANSSRFVSRNLAVKITRYKMNSSKKIK